MSKAKKTDPVHEAGLELEAALDDLVEFAKNKKRRHEQWRKTQDKLNRLVDSRRHLGIMLLRRRSGLEGLEKGS